MQLSLRAARINAGIGAKAASEAAGVHLSTLYNWERGRFAPDVNKARALCRLYCVELDCVFLGKKSTKSGQPRMDEGGCGAKTVVKGQAGAAMEEAAAPAEGMQKGVAEPQAAQQAPVPQ